MANPFDQFDEVATQERKNPFDQFDEPAEPEKIPPAFIDRVQAGRRIADAVKQQTGDTFDQRFAAAYGDPFEAAAFRTKP